MSSRIHKDLIYPYWIEIPLNENSTESTNHEIKDRKDEKILKDIYPEFFNE